MATQYATKRNDAALYHKCVVRLTKGKKSYPQLSDTFKVDSPRLEGRGLPRTRSS